MSIWGRCNPELDPDAHAPELERVGGPKSYSRRPVAVGMFLAAVLVGVLWLKPWQGTVPQTAVQTVAEPTESQSPKPSLAPGRTPHTSQDPPKPTPTPTPNPVQAAFDRRQCQSHSNWRLVTSEMTHTRATRTMYAVEPGIASGPADDNVPVSRLFAQSLRAVGVCVPWTPVMTPVEELLAVALWQVDASGDAQEIYRPSIVDPELFELGEAYYAPPQDAERLWPAGRYVFEIRRIAGGASRWMGIEFIPTDRKDEAAAAL